MKRNSSMIQKAAYIAALVVFIALLVRTFQVPGHVGEEYVPGVYGTAFALLPPAVAIVLALISREVYSSLFMGILVGALLYSSGNLELAFNTMMYKEGSGMLYQLTDISHASILVFVVLLNMLTTLMNKSGGSEAFGRWASKHIKSKVGAQLATMLLGIMIFVDDGFNCMTVGSVMRPLTDKYKVSRSKLAYIIDATAAPICIIAPISSWAAGVSYSLPADVDVNGFLVFVRTIPYNFYALGTIAMMLYIITKKFDYGPMKIHERNAENGDLHNLGGRQPREESVSLNPGTGKISSLIVPVVLLIVSCIIGMLYTGGFFEGAGFVDAFANSDAARGFVLGNLITILITFFFYMIRKTLPFKDFMSSLPEGWAAMVGPMSILVMAWTLSGMTGLLGARDFIHDLFASSAGSVKMFLPFAIFLVALLLAFSTGTSWGTFSILIPIVCNVFDPAQEMFVISIAACLAGSVCGDHCSPISDTTIMSSAGAKSDHINHVTTQMPYALTVAAVAAVSYLLAGIVGQVLNGPAAMVTLPAAIALMLLTLSVMRRKMQ